MHLWGFKICVHLVEYSRAYDLASFEFLVQLSLPGMSFVLWSVP